MEETGWGIYTPRRKDTIKMSLEKMMWGYGLNSTGSEYVKCRALVNTVISLGVHEMTGDFFTSVAHISFLRRALPHGVPSLEFGIYIPAKYFQFLIQDNSYILLNAPTII
jgi:hypothetical protein